MQRTLIVNALASEAPQRQISSNSSVSYIQFIFQSDF